MNIYLGSNYVRKYKKTVQRNPKLHQKVKQKLRLFEKNPQNSSLRLHKLSGKRKQWSISIEKDVRIIVQYVKDGIILVNIGSHDEVY